MFIPSLVKLNLFDLNLMLNSPSKNYCDYFTAYNDLILEHGNVSNIFWKTTLYFGNHSTEIPEISATETDFYLVFKLYDVELLLDGVP